MIDPFNDQRRAFQFRVNALGVQMEATNSDVDNSEDWSWDTIWTSAARITSDGYVDFNNSRAADFLSLSPEVEFNLGKSATGSLSHTFQTLDVEGGQLFEANLTQARAVYFFNIRTFARVILQYRDVQRDVSL